MDTVFIHHHLGLGDHLVCNGLVREFAKNYNVSLFCKSRNMYNVSVMFADIKSISLIAVSKDDDVTDFISRLTQTQREKYIKLGIALNSDFDYNRIDCCWDEIFYEQARLPFDLSWSNFSYKRPLSQQPVPDVPYAFICDKGSDGINGIDYNFVDNDLEKIYSNQGHFFDNLELIQNAKEIHTINSSYIHLIDRMDNLDSKDLFYHKNFIKKPYSNFTTRKKWKIL